MPINSKPRRLVHLDFHTSPDIPAIGSKFDKKKFQKALKEAEIESMTVFAKCHHGLCYYPTEVGEMHPNLNFDLTGAMLDAAHEIGVNMPIYITAGWSQKDATEHPEWIAKNKDGSEQCTERFKKGEPDEIKLHCAWQTLCLNDNGYCKHIYELTEEICKRYKNIDGLFYDICIVGNECYCDECREGMKREGYDVEKQEDVRAYFSKKRSAFMEKCGNILKKYHPEATIFFNSGGADQYRPQYHSAQTHFEMEDLPTAWGGYDKMPVRAKFFSKTGKHYFGMTAKFHLDWGEFGGFKPKEALRFEAVLMALYGAGCSVGDHIHPDCEIEEQTYENIGYAFKYLKKIEEYCFEGTPVVNLGMKLSENPIVNEGLSNILLENQMDYDIIYENDYSKFDTVIIPEDSSFNDEELEAVKNFIAKGGKVLAIGNGIVRNGEFIIDTGLEYLGENEYHFDYIYSNNASADVPNAPMLCNMPSVFAKNVDAEIYAEVLPPYFNRTLGHFCGHKNTPHNKEADRRPAISKKGNVVYMAHPMPSIYKTYGSVFFKRYLTMALDLIYNERIMKVSSGASTRCTLIDQPQNSRYCFNIAYAIPRKSGLAEIIEDITPIYNIKVELRLEKSPKKVYMPLCDSALKFGFENGICSFEIPFIEGHESVVIEY